MIGGLTLFGFDLFGLAQRSQARKEQQNDEHAREVAQPAKETAESQDERDPSEYYFWGMYPIY
jgi:hypothetical protein